jgi:hypothetical protein
MLPFERRRCAGIMSKPPATDQSAGRSEASEGVYTLEGRPAAKLESARTVLRRVPGARAAYDTYSQASTELRLAVRGSLSARRIRRDSSARDRFSRQAMRTIPSPLVDDAADARSLRLMFEAEGLHVQVVEGHIYLPPQDGLRAMLGAAAAPYPPDAALAIPVASLARSGAVPDNEHWFRWLLHANTPRSQDDSDRVYDLVQLGSERQAPAFVLRHSATGHTVLSSGAPALSRASLSSPPGEMLMEDVLGQDGTSTLHFGRERMFGDGRYLYQSIPVTGQPGRRDTAARWRRISLLLAQSGLSVKDRLILDVGCNAGMMLAAALADGAAWGLGWDLPEVSERAEALLLALGFTRFDLIGGTLSPHYELGSALPRHLEPLLGDSLVLYLAIRHHAGLVADLGSIPWRGLVYEGGETESVASLEAALAPLRATTEFQIAAAVDFRDGECLPRPLALLVR